MCGIVGYVGERSCRELLMHGLERLEYRGYDSAGLSLLGEGEIESVRSVGNLSRLREAVEETELNGGGTALATKIAEATTGIGHTRWATHGKPSERNAHPHPDCTGRIHIVLNGIIENYVELREQLEHEGHHFSSETDAEAVAHLIERHVERLGPGNLTEATRLAYLELRGHYAFVAISADEPDTIVGARKDCPLVVGVGDGEHFIASAIPAFLRETRSVKLVGDDEIVTIRPEGAEFRSSAGQLVPREAEIVTWDETAAEKTGYPTFMLKEINEQSDAVAETIADRLVHSHSVDLGEIGMDEDLMARCKRIVDRRLRHLLPRGPGRALCDRGVGARPGRDGHRLGVPLPQPGGRAGRPGDRDLPVRRDRGHAGGDAPCARARRAGPRDDEHPRQPGDARRARRAVHACRPRDRRGGHEDVRRPGGGRCT